MFLLNVSEELPTLKLWKTTTNFRRKAFWKAESGEIFCSQIEKKCLSLHKL